MTHVCTGSHSNCRLWKNCLSGVDKLKKLLGSDHSGVCAPKEKLELSISVLSLDPPPPWPALLKIQTGIFVSKWKGHFNDIEEISTQCLGYCVTQSKRDNWSTVAGSQDVWRMTHSIPYSLTTSPFQHYIAQQRVDRANSYPPELEHLLLKNI